MIELKFDTINIIIIYRRKIAKHDSVHINFCRLPQKFSYLLLFNSLLQILKFSDPYELFGLAPGPKKEQKILFAALILEPRFLNFGNLVPRAIVETLGPRAFFFYVGLCVWSIGAHAFLDPALKQGTKKPFGASLFGASIFKFWGLTFSGNHGLLEAPR